MNEPGKNLTERESPRTKTRFSGFSFRRLIGNKYSNTVVEVDRVKYGTVKDEVADGAILSSVKTGNDSKPIQVMFNRYNFKKILWHHGYFNSADIIVTANEFEHGIFIKGVDGKPDKINLIKETDSGCFVIGANRFNGYGVVTFFEQYNRAEATQYLDSLRNRGITFQSLGGRQYPPSIDPPRYHGL